MKSATKAKIESEHTMVARLLASGELRWLPFVDRPSDGELCFRGIPCPHCGKPINPAELMGSMTTPRKARTSAANGRKGGRPKGSKDKKPRKKR